jgi:predicted nucleotidyltransferase
MAAEAIVMVVTIAERKELEAERRRRAVSLMVPELASFGASMGGRYLLYGSAVTGRMRYDSDVNLLIDFPEHIEAAAWHHAEDLAARHDVPVDLRPLTWCTDAFRDRVLGMATSLP